MLGLSGVLFSTTLDEDPVLQGVVVLLCLGVPLVACGSALARYETAGGQRFLILVGMLMLVIGAVATVSGLTENLVASEMVSEQVGRTSQILGMVSLLVGLVALLFSVIRSQAVIDEVSERFRHIAEHMAEGFILVGPDGRIMLVNQSYLDMTGLTENDLIGKEAFALARELGAETMAEHSSKRAMGVASEYKISWAPEGKETREFWVNGTPIYDRRGRFAGALATVRDITERERMAKQLEEYARDLQRRVDEQTKKLRESEDQLRELLVHMNEGFVTLRRDHTIHFANARFCELVRTAKDEACGRPLLDYVEGDGRERLRRALEGGRIGSRSSSDQEYSLLRADGVPLPVKLSIAPVEEHEDQDSRYSIVVTDVSELKEMQRQIEVRARQLERANEELRELDEAKDVFLSNVSHELRTPLSTIEGYLEMYETGSLGPVSGPQKGALAVMARNAERLHRLINEMIESSRMELRGVRIYRTLFSPSRVVEECVASAQPDAMQKDITISVFVDEALPHCWGDREKVCQVLTILLSNAIKFSPEGAHVQVRAQILRERDVVFSVTDTGIGIADEHLESVFKKFYQVDDSMTRHYQGTGIGLSIAKHIVEAHGGHIEVASEVGRGSTFTVTLNDGAFSSAAAIDGELDELRIVVAHGQLGFREALAELVTRSGGKALDARTGKVCIDTARTAKPGLIILDETLPDTSGEEVLTHLKEDAETTEIPVIFLATRGESGEHGQIRLLDGVIQLEKPFTGEALMEQIRFLIPEPSGGRLARQPQSA